MTAQQCGVARKLGAQCGVVTDSGKSAGLWTEFQYFVHLRFGIGKWVVVPLGVGPPIAAMVKKLLQCLARIGDPAAGME